MLFIDYFILANGINCQSGSQAGNKVLKVEPTPKTLFPATKARRLQGTRSKNYNE